MDESEIEEGPKRCVRIVREAPVQMSGPMGTAIISRVPSFRVHCDEQEKAVFCTISHLRERLEERGVPTSMIEDALARAESLEDPGDTIEIEIG